MGEPLTHRDLVKRAERWLRNSAVVPSEYSREIYARKSRCPVVVSELVTSDEIPDAIGWMFGGSSSVLIECKASRADFLSDAKKFFRKWPQQGMGSYRYYMTPAGLLSPDELPEKWGLLEVAGRSVRVLKLPVRHKEWNHREEMRLMWSALRRVQAVSEEPEATEVVNGLGI